ncbi:uncharacterized protein [Arachis hypogaea]|uniref:uncharacterized protein n=1 Tax=Arachis hypogaea TaxID=3818 RepID=UPI003B22160C
MVSDRDLIFLSKFWKSLVEFSGTKLHYSTAYHPQSDSQTEVVMNRTLEQYLRIFTHFYPQNWSCYLSWAELCYNSFYHSSLEMSPHEALYGFSMRILPSYQYGMTTVIAVDEFLWAQEKMKKQADLHRRERQFQITQRVEEVAYHLRLPPFCALHLVFHISVLKPFHGEPPLTIPASPELPPSLQPRSLEILGRHSISAPEENRIQVLVDWEGATRDETTWKFLDDLLKLFAEVDLKDKVVLEGGIIDRSPSSSDNIGPSEPSPEENSANGEEQGVGLAKERESRMNRNRRAPTWMRDYVSK